MSTPDAPTPRKNVSVANALLFGLAVAAVAVLVVEVIAPLAANLIPSAGKKFDRSSREHCANNLKQLGIVYKMFANESKGEVYPQLSYTSGQLMFLSGPVYPEYLTDISVLLCPGDSDSYVSIDDHSYFYLGYAINNDVEMVTFAKVYETTILEGGTFVDDLSVPAGTGTAGNDKIYRIREGIERFYVTTCCDPDASSRAASTVPTMIERPENHEPPGGNVLYIDGHVEFIHYPGKWPMTEQTIGILKSLDAL